MNKKVVFGIGAAILLGGGIATGFLMKGDAEPEQSAVETNQQKTVPVADEKNAVVINLQQDGTTCDNPKVLIQNNEIKITDKGTYVLRGSLSDGKIKISAGKKKDDVIILLDNASVINKSGKAVYCKKAHSFSLQTKKGTKNLLQSGEAGGVQEKGATVTSSCDMSIAGEGELVIHGYRKNAIKCENELWIAGSANTVDALKDGLNADSIRVTDGTLSLDSGDDGIHSDSSLEMSGGKVTVTQAKEGLEGNQITISGGELSITSEDDGINAYGGETQFDPRGFGGKPEDTEEEEDRDDDKVDEEEELPMPNLNISGGKILINSEGDGLDSNGNVTITGGETIVNGPTNGGNGALDSGSESGGKITITGGTLLALGSSRMAETFEEESKQCSILRVFDESFTAGDSLSITDEKGNALIKHKLIKTADSVVFSSPELKQGSTYQIKVGTQTASVKQEKISESNSTYQGMGGPGHGGMGGPRIDGKFDGKGHPDGTRPKGNWKE